MFAKNYGVRCPRRNHFRSKLPLGPQKFRDGLRLYLKDHTYSNADWSDLVHALEKVSGRNLTRWAEMWIRHRGMPEVNVAWSCDGNHLRRLSLSQHHVLGTGDIWPIATQILLNEQDAHSVQMRVELDQPTMVVAEAAGKPCPSFLFANDQDFAYGRFLLDPASRSSVMDQLGGARDLFLRTLLWGSLWDSVRQARLAPRAYITLALHLLPAEGDPSLTQGILAHTAAVLHRYVSADTRSQFVPALESMAADRMTRDSDQNLRITWFRGLRSLAETPEGLGKLEALLSGQVSVPGVQLRPLDRWSLVTALIALGDQRAQAIFDAERERDPGGDGPEYACAAEAASPDNATKQKYFGDYL